MKPTERSTRPDPAPPGLAALTLALALAAGAGAGCARSSPEPHHPNLVLVTADTLRRDRLGFHGRPGRASPALDRLARRSFQFRTFVTASNNTNVSFASLHTGTYMRTHGVAGLAYLGYPLAERFDTLAEVLRRAGYRTLAAVSAPVLDRDATRLGQGFDRYLDCRRDLPKQPAEITNRRLLEALDAMRSGAGTGTPVFVWAHYFDPHWPYAPPGGTAPGGTAPGGTAPGGTAPRGTAPRGTAPRGTARDWHPGAAEMEVQRRLYEGEVRYLDRQIEALLEALEARGILGDAVVVLTADHGENLGEHGLFANHKRTFQTVSETSLLVHLPGQERGALLDAPAQTVDILPTCLDLLRIADRPRRQVEGRSLAPWIRGRGKGGGGGGTRPGRALFCEGAYHKESCVVEGRYKLVYRFSPFDLRPEGFALFDRRDDPGEERDLILERPAEAARLRDRLGEFLGPAPFRIRLTSRDGGSHTIQGEILAWKASVTSAKGRDLEPGDSVAAEPGGSAARFRCEVGPEDSDGIELAVDWSGTVGIRATVDGRPASLDEIWFTDFERARTMIRYLILGGPGGLEQGGGGGGDEAPPGPREWVVRFAREPAEAGRERIEVQFRVDPGRCRRSAQTGRPLLEARLFASAPIAGVTVEPEGAVSLVRREDRLRLVLQRPEASLRFVLAGGALAILADLRGPDGPLDPGEVLLARGRGSPRSGSPRSGPPRSGPAILYSPRLLLGHAEGANARLGERGGAPGAVRIEVSGARGRFQGGAPLDPATEARLRELGYVGDEHRQN